MAWNYQSYAIVKMEGARDHRGELMKLTKALQETGEELGLANIQLRHAHSAAEEAGRLKAQFAANVSHEFRTPINLIVGFSEMIVSNPQAYREPLPRAYWSDLQTICECAKHLQSLINDVLDMSQIEAGYMAMVKEFVDPRQVILDATNLAREMIEGAGLVFNLIMPDHLPWMGIDRTRIRQVLLNLLSNAVRVTNQGSITLQVKVDAKQLTMSITDTGTGIRQEDLSYIFDAYYQAEESDFRRSRGSGLGLTLSKQFVSSHGGSLSVESRGISGMGSTFAVILPLEDYTIHRPALQEGKHHAIEGDCFVVVDNDPAILKLFERYASKHRALGAQTIEEAFHLWRTVNPTAIIVGNERDREALLQGMQESNSPIAVISCPMPSGRRALQVEGVVDFLVKPVSQQTLYAAIEGINRPISNVLVIDDDQDIVRMFSRMIQTMPGVREVWKAYSGREGLALMRHQSPDAIILDVLMPDVDGLTTLQIMKNDPVLCDIPAIIVSASGAGEAIAPIAKGKLTVEPGNGSHPLKLSRCLT